jgi:hypothetical protein
MIKAATSSIPAIKFFGFTCMLFLLQNRADLVGIWKIRCSLVSIFL